MIKIPAMVIDTPIRRIRPSPRKRFSFAKIAGRRVPKAAQVPKEIDCPRATPKYRIDNPKVSPPTPKALHIRLT